MPMLTDRSKKQILPLCYNNPAALLKGKIIMGQGMDTMERVLGNIPDGAVLDVATGAGNFAVTLEQSRGGPGFIVATDAFVNPLGIVRDKTGENIIPAAMDAAALAFHEKTFSAVTISNSLHHMKNPVVVLAEMTRVLRPGGMLLIREMFSSEDQTPAQNTHNIMHNWWGAVDRSSGVVHNPIYTKHQLEDLALSSGISGLLFETFDFPCEDPFDEEMGKSIKGAWESYMKRASGNLILEKQGQKALEHFEKHGFAGARTLLVHGLKV